MLLLCDNGHYWTQWALRPDLWDGGAVIVVRDILVEACRSFPTRTRIAIRFPIIVWCFVLWFRGVRDGRGGLKMALLAFEPLNRSSNQVSELC